MENIIFYIIELIIAVLAFFIGRFIKTKTAAISYIGSVYRWSQSFAAYCAQFRNDLSGEEKMQYLVKCVGALCEKAGLEFSDEQLTAIGQLAYNEMKQILQKEWQDE